VNAPLAQPIDTVPAILTVYQSRIAQAMRAQELSPKTMTGRMSGYHMGWLDETGRLARTQGAGKLVRPSLCLWACEACGGSVDEAMPAATALEWLHNFTLIHDDIQDNDVARHGRPTLWTIWGAAQGINAGDALHALAFRALSTAHVDPQRGIRAVHALSRATLEVVEGQCLDLSMEGSVQVPLRGYVRMVRAKTGALLGASLEMGALMAGAPDRTVRRFRRAGYTLGLAFQMRDDWLGTWGDSELTGKSSAGDVHRRKASLPMVVAYAVLPKSRRGALAQAFAQKNDEATLTIRELLDEAGGAELTRATPQRFAQRAILEMRHCGIAQPALEDFEELAHYVANRSH
jgi:geranylgeranyl diphosphate synthase, type I